MPQPKGFPIPDQVARVLKNSEHLRIDPSQLEDVPEHEVMTGGFGTVRVAKFDDKIVAVKELRIAGTQTDRGHVALRFARELKVWAPLDHPNLLKLTGFYLDPTMSVALFICPFYEHGHIRKFIENNKPDSAMRFKLAEDTALGLRHLHELQIAHGDLKELNVLVGPEPRALLCDYGLSKMMNPNGVSSGLTTTAINMSVRFASPEILNGSRPDSFTDMWAWGCVFLKIILDIEPYHGSTEMTCMMKIMQGIPPVDVSTLSIVASLRTMLGQCWNVEPATRPSIEQCINIIELIMARKTAPLWSHLSRESMAILGTNCGDVHSVAFSPDGSLIASASNDGKARMWGAGPNELVTTLNCGVHIWAVAFSPNGKQLSCGLNDSSITIWDASTETSNSSPGSRATWTQNMKISAPKNVCSVAFSPDSKRVAGGFGLADGGVNVWNVLSGELLFTLDSDGSETKGLSFSPDGKWLAFCSWGTAVWIQDTAAAMHTTKSSGWAPLVKLEGHMAETGSVAFSSDGRWLASAGLDQSIIIRNVPSWTIFATLTGEEWIISMAFSPDNTVVATGTLNGNIQLWDVRSKRLLVTLKAHEDSVRSVAFSPDGKSIVSGSLDHIVKRWYTISSSESDASVESPT